MRMSGSRKSVNRIPKTFIDLFAGCGGLSLGLTDAGWTGVFGAEKNPMAFETLKANFLDPNSPIQYQWPDWLSQKAWSINSLIRTHRHRLRRLRGKIGLVCGGPPCQGFSFAGKRKRTDSRNNLYRAYVEFVKLVNPPLVVLENVRGVSIVHGAKYRNRSTRGRRPTPFSSQIVKALSKIGYTVFLPQLVTSADYGVPQARPRMIIFGIRSDLTKHVTPTYDPYDLLSALRGPFLRAKGLPTNRAVTTREAISDLERRKRLLTTCTDPVSPPGFLSGLRSRPTTPFQKLMQGSGNSGFVDSHRFANHTTKVGKRFARILRECRRGIQLGRKDRKKFRLKKLAVVPLSPRKPCHTLTTLPDDLIHYKQPRILTPREYARIQTFPDWFVFRGKYTSGGARRKRECPRYTQIGNAVPPFLAHVTGLSLLCLLAHLEGAGSSVVPGTHIKMRENSEALGSSNQAEPKVDFQALLTAVLNNCTPEEALQGRVLIATSGESKNEVTVPRTQV